MAGEHPFRDPLTERAATTPEAVALVDAADGETTTYGRLADRVAEMAGRLRAWGVEPADHVGVLMETRPAFIRLVHAGLRLGAPIVPINARLAPPEVADRVRHADVARVVCERDTRHATSAVEDVPVACIDDRDLPAPADPVDPARWTASDGAFVVFTSGTSGRPNAVVVTLWNVVASAGASAVRLGVLPDDRWHLTLPMYHMGGLAPVLRSTLYGTTVVLERTGGGFDPAATLAAMQAHQPTGVSLVPTMLDRLLDAGDLPDSLRFVLLGGAAASSDLLAACADRDVPVYPTYGTTETASQIATATPAEAREYHGTVGRPLLGTDVTVVDEAGASLPPGEVGEIVVSGPTVTPGYYGDPERTREVRGEHGLHTGDVGYRDDAGRLWVQGRRSDRIVTGGETVDPETVRTALRDHPAVADAAVVGLPDDTFGERVAALLVAEDIPSDLTAHCRERLGGFERPRTVAAVGELPRTVSGTVDRVAVRDHLLAEGVDR